MKLPSNYLNGFICIIELIKSIDLSIFLSFSEWVTVVAGGFTDDRVTAKAIMYRNGRTVALPDLPHPLSAASLMVYKDKVRLCGGYFKRSHHSKDCFQLSIFNALSKWEKTAELPFEMYARMTVQVLDQMWVFYDSDIYVMKQTGRAKVIKWPHDTVSHYSCAQSNGVVTVIIPDKSRHVYINSDATWPGSWTIHATLPTGLHRRSCLMIGSLFYVTGGNNGATYSKETYVIDIEERERVTRVGDLLTARHSHTMGVIDGAAAVFGGWNVIKYFDDTEIFHTNTNKWHASDIKMVEPSGDIAAVSFAVN